MGISVVTASTHDPVTLEELKWQARVDGSDDDSLMRLHIKAAVEYCEEFTGLKFVTATYDQTFDTWSNELVLDKPPLSSVTSVKYYDEDGVEQTLSSAVYDAVTNRQPGMVRLAYDQSWPTHRAQDEPITVQFVAGHGDAADVPDSLRLAVLLYASHLHEHREAIAILPPGSIFQELPMALKDLLRQNRLYEVT